MSHRKFKLEKISGTPGIGRNKFRPNSIEVFRGPQVRNQAGYSGRYALAGRVPLMDAKNMR
jgi:hypothetical protein